MSSQRVLDFWFSSDPLAFQSYWFKKDPEFDLKIKNEFEGLTEDAIEGRLTSSWSETPESKVALIIVLDQFPRNIYREQPRSFAGADLALSLSKELITSEDDLKLSHYFRFFAYMPLMHSEDILDQDLCVASFEKLGDVKFAIMHRDVIVQFGRFPHRNSILGRESTPEELEYLSKPGSGF